MTRLPLLLAVACLGSGAALLGGRALLTTLPPLTAATPDATLAAVRRLAPDPELRREASLLLASRRSGEPARQLALLRAQGWGRDPLAAVVLTQTARAEEALGDDVRARQVWQLLLRRFRGSAASADALYALGRRQPALRRELMALAPAHPAALAAALEAGPDPAARLAGALHLGRWGPRWPGAEARLRQHCAGAPPAPDPRQRAVLAEGLARLGDGAGALRCLTAGGAAAEAALTPAGQLALARALLQGPEAEQRPRAMALLVAVAQQQGGGHEAREAVGLLAQQQGTEADAALAALPERWRNSAPVAARRVLADPAGRGAEAVLRRWPADPASWELQWELARRHLLAGRWPQAAALLEVIPPARLPAPLAARSRFWLGWLQAHQGQPGAARATWQDLRRHSPGGYYGWRAAVQLGEDRTQATDSARENDGAAAAHPDWEPLDSGVAAIDRLWRLDQRTEAWEAWRLRQGGQTPLEPAGLLVEGRLRQGVGDDWTGLGQLEQAALRLRPDQCALLPRLERSLHPDRFGALFRAEGQRQGLDTTLLQGLAKQESRFTATVQSGVGAVGLMQLMPATAAELAGRPLTTAELEDPARNVALGSRYLAGLLRQWQGNRLVAVASYNAGPGAVQGWIGPQLQQAPELWVEAIPFPETRLYVKKVLGNAWSYGRPGLPGC